MKLFLKKLRIMNFKGSEPKEIEFAEITNVYGDNRKGKTRLVDAFLWLLTGKDSQDKADFPIKPIDPKTELVIHNQSPEVEAEFETDEGELTLMRVYKEKWTTPKGSSEAILTGHETDYYTDTLNVKKSIYEDEITRRICDIDKIRLLTDPFYLPMLRIGASIDWKKQREILFSLQENITDKDVANLNPEFSGLLERVGTKQMSTYREIISKSFREFREELKQLPIRIDELSRKTLTNKDFNLINNQLFEKEKQLKIIEEELFNSSKAYEAANNKIIEAKRDIYALQDKAEELNRNIKLEYDKKNRKSNDITLLKIELDELALTLNRKQALNNEYRHNILIIEDENINLRESYKSKHLEVFILDPNKSVCPTCKREFEDIDKIESELRENFNKNRVETLNKILNKGNENKILVKNYQEIIDSNTLEIELLQKNITEKTNQINTILIEKSEPVESFESYLSKNEEYNNLLKFIEAQKINIPSTAMVDNIEIQKRKLDLITDIDNLKDQLREKIEIENIKSRIIDLKNKMKVTSQEISNKQNEIDLIDLFVKTKISIIEESINKKFTFAKFKFYEQQVNGEYNPTCTITINGVPYFGANTESKLNAGLDIIKTFSKHYNCYLPVFIDNREGVTNIIDISNQVINLFKKTGQNELLIEKL